MPDNLGDLNVNITGDIADLDTNLGQAIQNVQQAAAGLSGAFDQVIQSVNLTGGALAIFTAALREDEQAGLSLTASLQGLADGAGNFPAIAQAAAAALDQLGQNEQIAATNAQALADAIKQAAASMDAFGSSSQSAGQFVLPFSDSLTQVNSQLRGAGQQLSMFSQAETQAAEGAAGMAPAMTSASGATEQLSSSVTRGIGNFYLMRMAIQTVATAISSLISDSLAAAANLERMTVAFTALSGSSGAAQGIIDSMKELASTTLFSFDSLTNAAQKMEALGIEAAKIPQVMQAAADAAAALGGNQDKLASVADALGRIADTGILTSRSLKALAISWDEIGQQMDATAGEAKIAFTKGWVDAASAIDIVTAAMREKFGGLAQAEGETLGGLWNRMKTQMLGIFQEIGTIIEPWAETVAAALGIIGVAVQKLSKFLADALPNFTKLSEWVKALNEAWPGLGDKLKTFAGDTDKAGAGTERLTHSFEGLNKSLTVADFGAQHILNTQKELNTEYTLAVEVLTNIQQQVKAGTANSDDLARAQKAVDAAFKAAHPSIKQQGTDIDELNKVIGVFANQGLKILEKMPADLADFEAGVAKGVNFKGLESQLQNLIQTMQGSGQATNEFLSNFITQMQAAQGKLQGIIDQDAFGKLAVKVTNLAEKFPTELAKLPDSMQQYVASMQQAATDYQAVVDKLDPTRVLKNLLENQKIVDTQLNQIGTQIDKEVTRLQSLSDKPIRLDLTLFDSQKDPVSAVRQQITTLESALSTLQSRATQYGNDYMALEKTETQILALMASGKVQNEDDLNTLNNDLAKVRLGMDAVKAAQDSVGSAITDTNSRLQAQVDVWNGPYLKAVEAAKILGLQTSEEMQLNINRAIKYTEVLAAANQPLQLQIAAQERILQLQLQKVQATGADANAVLLITERLTALHARQGALLEQTMALSNLYTGMVSEFSKGWDELSKGIGDAIVNGQNFGAVMMTVLKNIEQSVSELVVKYLMTKLKDALLQNTDLLSNFNKVFGLVFGYAFDTTGQMLKLGHAVKGVDDGLSKAAAAMGQVGSATGSAAGGMQQAATGLLGQVASMVSMVAAIGTLISGIVGNFQNARMIHLLSEIEVSTRAAKEQLVGGVQTALNLIAATDQTLLDWVQGPQFQLMVTMSSTLDAIAASGIGGGTGGVVPPPLPVVIVPTPADTTPTASLGTFTQTVLAPISELPTKVASMNVAIAAGTQAVSGWNADLAAFGGAIGPATRSMIAAADALSTATVQAGGTISVAAAQIAQAVTLVLGTGGTVSAGSNPSAIQQLPPLSLPYSPGSGGTVPGGLPYGPQLPASNTTFGQSGVVLNISVTGNNVAGDASAHMLAQKVGQIMVTQLRTLGGLKI